MPAHALASVFFHASVGGLVARLEAQVADDAHRAGRTWLRGNAAGGAAAASNATGSRREVGREGERLPCPVERGCGRDRRRRRSCGAASAETHFRQVLRARRPPAPDAASTARRPPPARRALPVRARTRTATASTGSSGSARRARRRWRGNLRTAFAFCRPPRCTPSSTALHTGRADPRRCAGVQRAPPSWSTSSQPEIVEGVSLSRLHSAASPYQANFRHASQSMLRRASRRGDCRKTGSRC